MTVRQYVQANFTEIEQGLFDYLLNSFPESVLVQEEAESEDILALLATLAKVIGSSKELILNLKTAHSLDEIFQKIENDYLEDNNKKLLLPFATDLKYHRLPEDLETDELLDRLTEEKHFLMDHYNLYKNRGTLTAITQIVKKWAAYLGQENLIYTLYELKDEVNIVLEGLDEFADFAGGSYTFNVDGETVETTFLRKDIIIFDMLMSIKPVGTKYNILLRYFAYNIENVISDRIIREDSSFIPEIKISNAALQAVNPQVTELDVREEDNRVGVRIKNPSNLSALKAYFADWSNSQLLQEDTFENVKQKWFELDVAVEPTINNANKYIFIYATEQELNDALQNILPATGTKAIVTGYEWVPSTEEEYNIVARKLSYTKEAESISFITPSLYDMYRERVPNHNLWQGAGSVVVKFTKTWQLLSRTRYYRLRQVIPGGYNGGVDTVDNNNYGYFEFARSDDFSFQEVIVGPGLDRFIYYDSTDPSYNYLSSYLGAYFTRPDDNTSKSPTVIIPFAALQGGNDKFAQPISESATPSASVTAGAHYTLSNITASATPSVQTDIVSATLRAKVFGSSFAPVTIEGRSYLLNDSSLQEVAFATSEKTSSLEAPETVLYQNTEYEFVQWYDLTNDVEISTNAVTNFTWDGDTNIEARYIPGGGFA